MTTPAPSVTLERPRPPKPEPLPPFGLLFGTDAPVEVEIGCGKGKFLVARAEENPGTCFLGIDRVIKWMRPGQKKAEKRALGNLKFIKADIRLTLEHFEGESVSVYHVYFPDPWPKRRHRKRRLIQEDFLKELARTLKPGGQVHFATDDGDYFSHIQKVVTRTADLWSGRAESQNRRIAHETLKTNYELKYEKEGRRLYYLTVKK